MLKNIARVLFYLMAVVTIAWTASLTYNFVAQALPGATVTPFLALFVFDLGMIAWAVVFLYHAEGSWQRATALIGTVADFLGVGLMAVAQIFLGGQTLTVAPTYLAEYALWGIGLWTVANVGLVLGFHLLSPEARRDIAIRDAQDSITELAFQQLKVKKENIAGELADSLGENMLSDLVRSLTAGHSPNGHKAATTYAAEVPAVPNPTPPR